MNVIRKWSFLLVIGLTLVLVACGNPVADDLEHYVNNELSALAELEEEAIAEYDSVVGNNHTDDHTTYIHLDEVVIPMYRDFIDQLEEISLESSEVREVHEMYVEAANTQYNAFVKIMAAIENADYDMVNEANDMLAEARAGMREYDAQLKALVDENGLEFEE